jgi:hypothetical protein
VAGVVLFGIGLWAFQPAQVGPAATGISHAPGATASYAVRKTAPDTRIFTLHVDGTPNLPIALEVTGGSSPGKRRFRGTIPQEFEFRETGATAITVTAVGPADRKGDIELTLSKGGKVIATGMNKTPQNRASVTGR